MRRFLLLLASLASLLVLPALASDPRVAEVAYTRVLSSRPAFRTLTRDSVAGSASARGGTRGALFYVNDTASYDALLALVGAGASASAPRVAVVMETTFFTAPIIRALNASIPTDRLAAVLVIPAPAPEDGFSPAEPAPNGPVDINAAAGYQWNPLGTSLSFDSFPFPLTSITGSNAVTLRRRALANAARRAEGSHPGYTAHARQYMFSTLSSENCFEVNNCYPIGGYSVWATLGNLTATNDTPSPATNSSKREIVLVASQMDAAAFFPGRAHGADAAVSGTVVTLAAAHALSQVEGVMALERNLIFALFNGEKFDYVGSRNFFGDLYGNFTCPEGNERLGTSPNGTEGVPVGCNQPFRTELAFKNVRIYLYVDA